MGVTGLNIVFTGNGKGKTSAALGLAVRAAGHGMRVCMIQFIKGTWKYGELSAPNYLPGFEIIPMGRGFVCDPVGEGGEAHAALAQKALAEVCRRVASGEHDIVIMDEVLYAIHMGLVLKQDVVDLMRDKPGHVHLVLTGRNAPEEVIDAADMVTEMKEIKHPFHHQVGAQKGIEF